MKNATVFVLVSILLLALPLASHNTTAWYEDPNTLLTVGFVTTAAYLVGGRLHKGLSKVLPVLLTSVAFGSAAALTVISQKLHLYGPSLLTGALLLSFVVYKSLKTCPATGHPGCCCGIAPH